MSIVTKDSEAAIISLIREEAEEHAFDKRSFLLPNLKIEGEKDRFIMARMELRTRGSRHSLCRTWSIECVVESLTLHRLPRRTLEAKTCILKNGESYHDFVKRAKATAIKLQADWLYLECLPHLIDRENKAQTDAERKAKIISEIAGGDMPFKCDLERCSLSSLEKIAGLMTK